MSKESIMPKEVTRILKSVNHHLQTEVRAEHKQHGINLKIDLQPEVKIVRKQS